MSEEEHRILDDEGKLTVPMKRVVCDRCNGTGAHVNPAIDAHGIGAEEWERDWDDDERVGYFTGRYDVRCEECNGDKVIEVPDEEQMTRAQIEELHEHYRDMRELRQMEEAERRMGA